MVWLSGGKRQGVMGGCLERVLFGSDLKGHSGKVPVDEVV